MVAREWQSALMSSVNSGLKFVPIRLDDCNPPVIMKDLLYIDLYGIGIDEAIFQMKAVVNQENNYKPLEDKENLVAILHKNQILKSNLKLEQQYLVYKVLILLLYVITPLMTLRLYHMMN
ncbi:hypothetical protein HMPREF1111_0215 [Streptococcus infantis ATCC 700779]|nr:hypothetical protein HMPREF1111_0215 [Streptococcus infantis ATCC 700779]